MLLSLGVQDVVISVPEDLVVVDATLKTSEVHALLESTGLLVFFRGFGGQGSTERGNKLLYSSFYTAVIIIEC